MKKVLVTSICFIVLFMSCMTTKTTVGTFKEEQGKEYTYAKGKQFWLFWGLVPVGRTDVSTPTDGSCKIVTKYKLFDVLITSVTGGLVSSYSIKVIDKKKETN